jgi:hypothetical protein
LIRKMQQVGSTAGKGVKVTGYLRTLSGVVRKIPILGTAIQAVTPAPPKSEMGIAGMMFDSLAGPSGYYVTHDPPET